MPCNDYRKFVEIQILIEQFSVAVVSVDSSHCFEVDSVCNTEGLIASDAHTIAFFSGQSVDLEQSDL